MRDLLRFFRVVPPVPRLMMTTFTVVTTVAVGAIAIDRRYAAGMIDAVLVLQLFAAASGFAGNARRGYYDLLLTRGHPRALVAAVHCGLSIAPGVASWGAVSIAEAAFSGGASLVGPAPGTIVALAVTSAMAWAITVPLPRFAGAIGWVIAFAIAAALQPDRAPDAIRSIVFPLSMVGQQALPAASTWASVILSIGSIVAALVWVERADVRLEAAQ